MHEVDAGHARDIRCGHQSTSTSTSVSRVPSSRASTSGFQPSFGRGPTSPSAARSRWLRQIAHPRNVTIMDAVVAHVDVVAPE